MQSVKEMMLASIRVISGNGTGGFFREMQSVHSENSCSTSLFRFFRVIK